MVRRCHYCPSLELSGIHFRPRDLLLLCVGIRRKRCNFCGRLQWTWLLPRPVRWGLVIAMLGTLYLATTGPVKWLHDNYKMEDATYDRLNTWVYWPINRWLAATEESDARLRSGYLAYLEWWAPAADSMRADDSEPLIYTTSDERDEAPPQDQSQPQSTFVDAIEYETQRPVGDAPPQ